MVLEKDLIEKKDAKKVGAPTKDSPPDNEGASTPSHTIPLEKNFTVYSKKKQAEEKIDDVMWFFPLDLNKSGAKQFAVTSRNEMYERIKNGEIENGYEGFTADCKVKLFVDIDIKKNEVNKILFESDEYLNTVIDETIQLVNDNLSKYIDVKPQIIILSASTCDKLSAHIIYTNIYFKNIKEQKFFFTEIDSELTASKIIDPSVYIPNCFRMFKCSKYGKDNKLIFYKSINYEKGNDKNIFMDSLICNVTEECHDVNYVIKKYKPVKHKKNNDTKYIVNQTDDNININQKISLKMLQKYVNIINPVKEGEYDKWIKIGICLRTCNGKAFDVWHEYSKRSYGYDSENMCAMKWNSFTNKSIHFGFLKKLAKEDNPDEYEKLEYGIEEENFEVKTFHSKYVIDTKETLSDRKCLVSETIDKLMKEEFKMLAINSPCGSGKTTLIKLIIEQYNPKKMLFVTYRQTLTNSFSGEFKKYDVGSYLDGCFLADRVICQYDSLGRLIDTKLHSTNMLLDDSFDIPSYDLIVLDEIESILYHSAGSTVKNKEKTFDQFKSLIYNSKFVIALDSDFSNRSYDFLSYFGECLVLKNTCREDDRNFIFMENQNDFNSKINCDLENEKNVCIVSMSSTIAMGFYEKYKNEYESVLHCAKSDDILKKELKNVNEFWKKYQLVVYSPTIEGGVDFNIEHFDNVYIVLSTHSCSPRGLSQMSSRVRTVKDKNIHVFLNGIPFNTKTSFYKHEEVKDYVFSTYKKYFPKVLVEDEDRRKMTIKYKYDLWSKIVIYNEQENLNSNPYYFVSMMIKILSDKGCTYEYLNDTRISRKEAKKNKTNLLKEEILCAENIKPSAYFKLLKKQQTNCATQTDKMKIEKHFFKLVWKVDEINEEFLDKYIAMTPTLLNLRNLVSGILGDIMSYYDAKYKEKIEIVKELISGLGFDSVMDKKMIKGSVFWINRENIETTHRLFVDKNTYYPLFNLSKKKIVSNKAYLGLINGLFRRYGFVIKCIKKNVKINKKVKKEYSYHIHINKELSNFVYDEHVDAISLDKIAPK